jgi:hypothetical protein
VNRLAIFDVDGTLCDTVGVDDEWVLADFADVDSVERALDTARPPSTPRI